MVELAEAEMVVVAMEVAGAAPSPVARAAVATVAAATARADQERVVAAERVAGLTAAARWGWVVEGAMAPARAAANWAADLAARAAAKDLDKIHDCHQNSFWFRSNRMHNSGRNSTRSNHCKTTRFHGTRNFVRQRWI